MKNEVAVIRNFPAIQSLLTIDTQLRTLSGIDENTKCFIYDRIDDLGWIKVDADIWTFSIFEYVPILRVPLSFDFNYQLYFELNERIYYKTYNNVVYFAYFIPMEVIRTLYLPFGLILIEGKKFEYHLTHFITKEGELIGLNISEIKSKLLQSKTN